MRYARILDAMWQCGGKDSTGWLGGEAKAALWAWAVGELPAGSADGRGSTSHRIHFKRIVNRRLIM